MQAKFAIIRPFTQPMEDAPFLHRITLIVPDQPSGVKDKKISTLTRRVLIVYTQFMIFCWSGVYYGVEIQAGGGSPDRQKELSFS